MKIHIVSGFLGSGKTSLLRHLLMGDYLQKKEADFRSGLALIENEFGKIAFDAKLLAQENMEIPLYELESGCLCCSLQKDFISTIKALLNNERIEHLFIEPSGVALTGELVAEIEKLILEQSLFGASEEWQKSIDSVDKSVLLNGSVEAKAGKRTGLWQAIKKCFIKKEQSFSWQGKKALQLGRVIHLIDAQHFFIHEANFKDFYKNQIKAASLFLVNRIEGLAEEQINKLTSSLQKYNKQAEIIYCKNIRDIGDDLLWDYVLAADSAGLKFGKQSLSKIESSDQEKLFDQNKQSGQVKLFAQEKLAGQSLKPRARVESQDHHKIFETLTFYLKGSLAVSSKEKFREQIQVFFAGTEGGLILRSKGFLPLDAQNRWHFEYTSSVLDMQQIKVMDYLSHNDSTNANSYLVVIGQNLAVEKIRLFLAEFFVGVEV